MYFPAGEIQKSIISLRESSMNFDDYNKAQEKENKNIIAIDFDGVIHKSSRGFHDGTIYDDPIEGSIESIKNLKKEGYKLIIYTCKANPNRPKIKGKDGIELIWEWLEKHNISQFISDVVWGKPWAKIYIDDKGYRFENWDHTLDFIKNLK